MAHTCGPSNLEAEAGDLIQVPSKADVQNESLSQKPKQTRTSSQCCLSLVFQNLSKIVTSPKPHCPYAVVFYASSSHFC